MKFIENKWMRAAVPALLIHCSIGTVYCWSSFSTSLADEIGTSPAILGFAFSLAIFFLGMSAAFAGPFIERNIHKSSLIACICFIAGMMGTGACIRFTGLLGTSATVAGIFVFYGCIMGVGLGVGYLTPVKTLMLWFKDNPGLGTGISIMGFGLAKAIASPLMNTLQETIGLANMFFVLSGMYFIMMMLGHFLLKKPEGWVEPQIKFNANRLSFFKNKTFAGIWFMFYINITCGLALISYEKPILQLTGFGMLAISAVQSLTAASNALGRIGFSTFSDHLRNRNTVYKIIFMMCVLVCLVSFATSAATKGVMAVIVALMLVVNAGYGGGFSTLPALLSSRFGMSNISTIHGVALSAWAFAGLSGNQLTALVLRLTGSYEVLFAVLAGLYMLGFVVAQFVVGNKAEMVDLVERRVEDIHPDGASQQEEVA